MEFQKIFGDPEPQPDWYGVINFTLAVYLDCKWHQYKYSIEISEEYERKQPRWCSKTPDPRTTVGKPSAESKPDDKPSESKPAETKPADKPPDPKPAEDSPPEGEKPKKKIGKSAKRVFECIFPNSCILKCWLLLVTSLEHWTGIMMI